MKVIQLKCPNCQGNIPYRDGKSLQCPYCETELLIKENNIYYIDQSTHHYYGTVPERSKTNIHPGIAAIAKSLVVLSILALAMIMLYINVQPSTNKEPKLTEVRTMPQSEVLLFFLRDVFDKGSAMPTEEELGSIRYLKVMVIDNKWHITYSLDDPFTMDQPDIVEYVVKDKILNTQEIDQKDFEAFTGLSKLDLANEYEVRYNDDVSFRHMTGLKSYGGRFNESFRTFAEFFADKSSLVELTTQIRNNNELALLLSFPNLQSLTLSYIDDSVTDFHLLAQLPLQQLSVHFVDDLSWLSAHTGLKSLEVVMSEATNFTPFYSLTQLEHLRLEGMANLKALDFINNMPRLESLTLERSAVSSIDWLKNQSSLTKLALISLSNLKSLEGLEQLTGLTDLTVTGYYDTVPELTFPHLRTAVVRDSVLHKLEAPALQRLTIADISHLSGESLTRYPQLEQLVAEDVSEFVDIQALNGMPNLKRVQLTDAYMFDDGKPFFELQYVNELSCEDCQFRIDWNALPHNTNLEQLKVNKLRLLTETGDWVEEIDKIIPYLANLTALRSFTLQDDNLSKLDTLRNWQHLELLHLENNALVDVESLTALPQLKKVYLQGNPVQNASLLKGQIKVYQ